MAQQFRFKRDYELVVTINGNAVVIKPPLRVSFSADKSVSGGLNKMTCKVYNLSSSNRAALVKDAEDTKIVNVLLSVGYESGIGTIFKGTLFRGSNTREGVDLVTELECLDGGTQILNGFTAATVLDKSQALEAIRATMPGIGKGKITKQQELVRPKVIVGANARLLDDLMEDNTSWYIDNEQIYILKKDEVISRFIPEVSSETGLLNTPTRDKSKATFDSLMNPTLKLGGLCSLKSEVSPHYNGIYKIESMGYVGDNYGAQWQQSITGMLAQNYKVVE